MPSFMYLSFLQDALVTHNVRSEISMNAETGFIFLTLDSFAERNVATPTQRKLHLPSNSIILAVIAGTAPEASVFPIKVNRVDRTAGAIIET
jgi:hypothetical protein